MRIVKRSQTGRLRNDLTNGGRAQAENGKERSKMQEWTINLNSVDLRKVINVWLHKALKAFISHVLRVIKAVLLLLLLNFFCVAQLHN